MARQWPHESLICVLLANAAERDPEKAVYYHELHEAHKRNPEGYKKLYPNFFGFLVATFQRFTA